MGSSLKPRIVLSAVNFVEGGPLSIYQDALRNVVQEHGAHYEIVALVHDKRLFPIDGVTFMEFPKIKSSWLRRVRFEYKDCLAISQKLRPRLWLALHDMTPNVEAGIRCVYCHNPAPFYRLGLLESLVDWKFTLFRLFYRYLYRINLSKNRYVIVQQQWLREAFSQRYGARNTLVARPSVAKLCVPPPSTAVRPSSGNKLFFYPAFPRSFKNVELLLEAVSILEKRGVEGFEVLLTLRGDENKYSRRLRESYGSLRSVRWLGRLSREAVMEQYTLADFLVFPSRLETWGMPISEFKQTGKPMIVADLSYAHETVGEYASVTFFDPENSQLLASIMEKFLRGQFDFSPTPAVPVAMPYAKDWTELFHILLS